MTIALDVLFRGDVAPLPAGHHEGDLTFSAPDYPDEVLLQLTMGEMRLTVFSNGDRVCEIVRLRRVCGGTWRSSGELMGEPVVNNWHQLIDTVHQAFIRIAAQGGQWMQDADEAGVVDATEALA